MAGKLKWRGKPLLVMAVAAFLSLAWFSLEETRQLPKEHWLALSVFVISFLGMALVGFNIELSRRTRAEHDLSEQRKLLESIVNNCSDAVVVADSAGKIVLRNPAAASRFPVVPPSAVSQQIPLLLGIYKPDGATLYDFDDLPLPRALRGETVNGLEMCVRTPGSAEPEWLLAAGNPLTDEKGERNGGVIFLRDITDRKRTDERLKAALLESEASAMENAELTRLADLLQSCPTLEEAGKISENILPRIFLSQPGALFLINSSRNLLEAAAVWNDCSTTEQIFNPDDCWALRLGKLYWGADPGSPMRCSHVSRTLPQSHLCVPLVAQGETLGVLYVEENPNLATQAAGSSTAAAQHKKLQNRVVAVAERLSLALSSLKLREVLRNQSIRDPLTGLFNRRYLEESLAREVHRAARRHSILSAIMIDLDHYKRFNDAFGHQAGDLLLREIGGVLKSRVRAGDLACRYGGEEFALILSEVDANGARKCIEAIREEIRHFPLQYRGQGLSSVTVSAGIAEFPIHGDTPEDLIRAADAALYQAKREGRDRVVTFSEEVTTPA